MSSRTNVKPPGVPAPQPAPPPVPAPQAPSVPISIYRQVATELQTAQSEMDGLKAHNQELLDQNQQLRLEIERVVQSTLQLRQIADTYRPAVDAPEPSNLELHFAAPPAPNSAATPSAPIVEADSRPRRSAAAERSQDVGGWWLVLIILLIVVTAFGTGFLIVRPLLPNR